MGGSDAPKYPTTTASSGGIYGSSTTGESGTTYNPTDFEKNLVSSAQGGITSNYNNLMNGIYDSSDFNKYKSDLRQQQANGFENTVVNPLVNRGLLGTTGANSLSNQYGSTMAQQDSDLMDKFRNQTLQNLNTSAQMYTMPYDMMQGTSGLSSNLANSVGNYNAQMYAADQANKNAMWGNLAGLYGAAYKKSDDVAKAIAASDEKTKKNIRKIDEKNGINIYEFEYKIDKYPELPSGKQIGVIAQEVEHIPNAVIQGDRYKLVDYSVINRLIA